MGKGTDKLYITHSEWNSSDAYSASAGANVAARSHGGPDASFRRLPFNFCAASLQPFKNPVCTADGTIFDVEVISAWLENHNTNPVTGDLLSAKELIRLEFARNAEDSTATTTTTTTGAAIKPGDLVDPVTFKVFTDNTHIVAVRHGTYANVFAWDTVERMNIKTKMWRDLVDDVEFRRKDIITLQDPQNIQSRDMSRFRYLKDGGGDDSLLVGRRGQQDGDPADEQSGVNIGALGRIGEKVLRAKSAVERARKDRETGGDVNRSTGGALAKSGVGGRLLSFPAITGTSAIREKKKLAPNVAVHTTGRTAASFTSTGLTPETSGERALLTNEEYLLKPKRVQHQGFARIETNLGDLTLELHTKYAPRTVWNFVRLAQKGYYDGVEFHRNLKGFMVQGGDPDGTGRGGASVWGSYFDDELGGPLRHDGRGVVSMANKGKNTNSSQFFITYDATPHLDQKHTIFGKVVEGEATLNKMEATRTGSDDRPLNRMVMGRVVIFVDPFAEFQKQQDEQERAGEEREQARREGNDADEHRTTWTGKRIRSDRTAIGGHVVEGTAVVGKYLSKERARPAEDGGSGSGFDEVDTWEGEPTKKKTRVGGGFGNFDAW